MVLQLVWVIGVVTSTYRGPNASALIDWRAGEPVPSSLIAFNTTESETLLLQESTSRAVFMSVMQHLVTQKTQTLCGVATLVSILNSLPIKLNVDQWYYPYPYETQEGGFFSECVTNVIPFPTVLRQGMTMDEVEAVAGCFDGVSARTLFANTVEAESFRTSASYALQNGHPLAVNFLRTSLDQDGGGHWSPVVSYSEEADRFLLLDVSRYKYPPVWVTTEQLFTAMDTTDSTSGKSRGWIELSAKKVETRQHHS